MASSLFFASGDLLNAVDLVEQCGHFSGLLVLAVTVDIWRCRKREIRLTDRIGTLEDDIHNVLLPLVKECTGVISRNTVAAERLEKHLER